MSQQVPVQEGLFTWPSDKPQMLGSRCKQCGEASFPAKPDCLNCGASDTEIVELGDRGTLWTWTIQGFMPKAPYNTDEDETTFRPYGVGYIEMPGGVRVESRLAQSSRDELKIGMPMELTIIPVRTKEDGTQLVTYCFSAVKED